MPEAVVFTENEYLPFKAKMLKKGYTLANKKDIAKQLQFIEAIAPYEHPTPGMEE